MFNVAGWTFPNSIAVAINQNTIQRHHQTQGCDGCVNIWQISDSRSGINTYNPSVFVSNRNNFLFINIHTRTAQSIIRYFSLCLYTRKSNRQGTPQNIRPCRNRRWYTWLHRRANTQKTQILQILYYKEAPTPVLSSAFFRSRHAKE